ncbi:MAG: hypothetical protein ACRCXC_02410 [Legionella sp.]
MSSYQKSTINSMRTGYANSGDTLMSSNISICNDEERRVQFRSAFGTENVIGKFFLETDLDWPEEYKKSKKWYDPRYKQPTMSIPELDEDYGKGVATVHLGRQGDAIITQSIMMAMNNYKSPQMTVKSPSSFSYDEQAISFSQNGGTQVTLQLINENLHRWLTELERGKALTKVVMGEKLSIFKINDNTGAINKGTNTPWIQIKNKEILILSVIISQRTKGTVLTQE